MRRHSALSDTRERREETSQANAQAEPSILADLSNSNDPDRRAVPKFATFAWFVLIYNLAAVAWGVFVRASKSGDGGGAQWPLLDLSHEPMNGAFARLVEGSHRVSTSLCGVLAIVLVVMAFKNFPKGHQARLFSSVALGLTLVEGLIGAALVLFGLVTTNDSAARVGVMSFHVISTMLLVSSIALAAMSALGSGRIAFRDNGAIVPISVVTFLGVMVLAVTGAINALSHTLMPVKNVLVQASNPDAHWMQQIQPLHPYLSVAVGLFVCIFAGLLAHLRPSEPVKRASKIMVATFCAQLLMGLANIRLEAPIWMQMVHLVLGDILFVSIVVAVAFGLMNTAPHREGSLRKRDSMALREAVKAYIVLTKPRVISLLLFTAGAAMFAAAKGWPGLVPFLAVMVGGYLSAGAANAMNMVVDRDIDGRMARTSKRPTVTQSISTPAAMNFSLALTFGSFAVLWAGANLWAAMIALAGQAFYVCIYTLYLKRRTWQNIVIGGAAGAVPPMVGWVAVMGSLNAMAWWMFALIFIWTPVHFWALALLLKDDYAEAGVPMLPVAKGEKATVSQISFYTALTVALSLLPFFVGASGLIFLISVIAMDLILIRLCVKLYRKIERPQASALFHYSMLYLALLFLAVAVDQRWLIGNF
ncbi:MAG: protoheme IX farnesyltransferase [Chlorobia bacterium]|nr:protoheme IX farnesyltransferase [Fimbriimonadaceae bacterium]